MSDERDVAVLGAGFLGSCLALELARRGRRVDLFDRAAMPVTGAGLNNEGKLHLGYLWAKDESLDTARLVAGGSLRFAHLVRRWIGDAVDGLPFGRPFHYAMPRASMVPEAELRRHVGRIDALIDVLRREAAAEGASERDLCRVSAEPPAQWLEPAEVGMSFDAGRIAAAARTREVAVDPHAVATAMRAAVWSNPSIRFRGGTTVASVAAGRDGHRVMTSSGEATGPFGEVVNALWDGRLGVDDSMGLRPARQWLWRAKASLRLPVSVGAAGVPNVTFMVGPFGDVSDYGNGASLLSWYPAGLLGASTAATPPPEWGSLDASREAAIARGTIEGLTRFLPMVGAVDGAAIEAASLVGGPIYAMGETDIDDPSSGLHARTNPGIQSAGRYHSVDPGKYCLVPLMAMLTADRVAGEATR